MCVISNWSWSLSQPNLNKWQDASPACICHVHPCSYGACSPCRHNESFHKHPRLLIIATYNLFWKCYTVDMLRKMLFLCIFWLWLVGNQAHLANADHTTYFCWLSPSLSLTKWDYVFEETTGNSNGCGNETLWKWNWNDGKNMKNGQRIPQDESTMRAKGLGFGPQCHRKGELQTWTKVLFHLTVLKRTDLGIHATPDQLSTRSRPRSVPLHSSLLLAICFCPLVFDVGLMRLPVRLGPSTAIMTGLML